MAKSILIKATLNGSGIVNFDSNDQKFLWNRQYGVEIVKHNNVSFGKGRYYCDAADGIVKKVGVISADCIRHAMYDDCMSIQLPNVMHDDECLLRVVANPALLVRGYLFARDSKTTWRRTSAFRLSEARVTSGSMPALETYSNSQPKTGKDKSEDTSETSFFKREVRGDTTYELSGGIDLAELGFISLSEVHDRLSFDSDYVSKYRDLFGKTLGSEIPDSGFFQKKGDIYQIPEQGILLTPDQVRFLVIDTLKRLARFNISRTVTGSAYTSLLQIKVVNDPLVDLFHEDIGWIPIFDGKKFDVSSLDNVIFDVNYSAVDLVEEAKQKVSNYRKKFTKEEEAKEEASKSKDGDDKEEPVRAIDKEPVSQVKRGPGRPRKN